MKTEEKQYQGFSISLLVVVWVHKFCIRSFECLNISGDGFGSALYLLSVTNEQTKQTHTHSYNKYTEFVISTPHMHTIQYAMKLESLNLCMSTRYMFCMFFLCVIIIEIFIRHKCSVWFLFCYFAYIFLFLLFQQILLCWVL